MELFKVFMDIFERTVAERNSSDLTELLKDSRKYFQNIVKNDSGMLTDKHYILVYESALRY